MSANTFRLALAAIVVLALGAWLWPRNGPVSPSIVSPETVAASAGSEVVVRKDRDAGPTRTPSVVEPAHADPARSDDAVAADEAWKYVERSQRCVALRIHEQWKQHHDADAAASPMDEATAETLRRECTGVELDWREVQQQLKRASELGSVEAQRAYAQDPRLNPAHASAELEAWRAWRERAPGYIDAAIARGDGSAAMLLGLASMRRECHTEGGIDGVCGRSFPLNAIVPRDDVVAFAHLLFAQQLGVGVHAAELELQMSRLASRLTPEQRVEATRRAVEMLHGAGN